MNDTNRTVQVHTAYLETTADPEPVGAGGSWAWPLSGIKSLLETGKETKS